MVGKTISHYHVIEKLGEGGMGVVYKARDTHLDRFVAIKILPPERVADAARKARFVQEAKAASALNHPNIITIHDIDHAGGVDFMVMEFVPGKTLDQMIPRHGMRLSEALKCAVQLGDALSKAHAAGIIHRDLKPGNVIVTEDGRVKVLDFGLAKLTEAGPLGEDEPTRTMKPATEEGKIVGTVAYMSPEQAEGKKVDARSDIFSFGSLFYEMVTGRRAFQGDSRASTLAAVLKDEPKRASQITPGLPKEVERLIHRCLRKDLAHRFQHMDDLKVALEELKEESDSGTLEALPAPHPARRWALAMVGGVGVVLLGAGVWYYLRPTTTVSQRAALTRLTADSGLTTHAVLSPDGTRLAYASDRDSGANLDIWIQQVTTGDTLQLTHDEADEYAPDFSPDGNRIAYRSEQDGGGIYLVSTLGGGEPKRIVREGRWPRFSPDGELIAYWVGGVGGQARIEGSVYVIPSEGGQPRQIRADFKRAGWPEWAPDGQHLLFYADQGGETPDHDLWVTSRREDGSPAVRTGWAGVLSKQDLRRVQESTWRWVAQGSAGEYLLFPAQSGDAVNIWRVRISPKTFQVSGPAEQLTFGTARAEYPDVLPVGSGGLRMVFASARRNSDVWSLPMDANRAIVKGPPQRITDQESVEYQPGISENGRKLIYTLNTGASASIWLRDLDSAKETRMATAHGRHACISRDGRRIVYANPVGFQAYMVAEGDPVLVCEDCFVPTDVTRDGEMLVDEARNPQHLRVVVTAQKKGVSILRHPTWGVAAGRLSPDERWIAFQAIPRIDARQIFVAPFRGPALIDEEEWISITDDQGMERYPTWSPDGNTIYFLSERDGFRCIRAQRLNPASKRPEGPPLDIYHFHNARLSLMNLVDPVNIRLQIAVDKAVLAIQERTGNTWMTELPAGSR